MYVAELSLVAEGTAMSKLVYWLKKLGILRVSGYAVKGSADKLDEVNAHDGGMIQSQKQIDEELAAESDNASKAKLSKQ